jgi:hypothetical protein
MKKFSALFLSGLLLAACSQQPEASRQKKSEATPSLNNSLGVDADSFVEGNLYFLGYHELGHALISELDLPVAGREEDAVDRLAIWMMTPAEDEGEPDYLLGAMHGWFLSAAQTPLINIPWWDVHGTDQQRGYQIACLLYGSNSKQFASVANKATLPEDSLDICVDEASVNDRAWTKLLEPHLRPDGDVAAADSVTVRYDDTKDYPGDAAYLKESGLLEDISEVLRSNYKIKPGISVIGTECGEINSYWQSDTRTISICYELVAEYRNLAGTGGVTS